jgi:hypothetical protein
MSETSEQRIARLEQRVAELEKLVDDWAPKLRRDFGNIVHELDFLDRRIAAGGRLTAAAPAAIRSRTNPPREQIRPEYVSRNPCWSPGTDDELAPPRLG